MSEEASEMEILSEEDEELGVFEEEKASSIGQIEEEKPNISSSGNKKKIEINQVCFNNSERKRTSNGNFYLP